MKKINKNSNLANIGNRDIPFLKPRVPLSLVNELSKLSKDPNYENILKNPVKSTGPMHSTPKKNLQSSDSIQVLKAQEIFSVEDEVSKSKRGPFVENKSKNSMMIMDPIPAKAKKTQKNGDSKRKIEEQIGNVHEGKKPYKCISCNKDFNSKSGLIEHFSFIHKYVSGKFQFMREDNQKSVTFVFQTLYEYKV